MRHKLTDKNVEDRTAVCSVCGPTAIRSAGKSWICLNKKRANEAAWREANPERSKANRAKPGAHKLTIVDEFRRSGTCVLCDEVLIVPWGRGWICGYRALELRRNQEVAPADRCQVCAHATSTKNPVVEGRCQFHPAHPVRPVNVEYLDPMYDEMPTVSLPTYEDRAAKVPAKESVVPGWKMAGQNVPAGEWAKWNELLASEGL